ncbi:hypothetical protein [Alkaliphilus transvaalensis]|uniref:hypothetical protein n=1 Tax=Alkaliphilus transvaalensis TaxID=114628 RepID=UPI00054FBD33|nr:hypothetical protein [Alkaliphilus transvaalensis]
MELKNYLLTALLIILSSIIFYQIISFLKNNKFNQYFQLFSQESYNLDDLFPIKLSGEIIPKKDYLEIPHDLYVTINTTAIQGEIKHNRFYIELIRPKDRKKALELVKSQYLKTVTPYIRETIQNKKEDIRLIELSKKQLPQMQKIACNTCKHKVQCQIAFTSCNYEREEVDTIIRKGIKVDYKDGIKDLNFFKKQ